MTDSIAESPAKPQDELTDNIQTEPRAESQEKPCAETEGEPSPRAGGQIKNAALTGMGMSAAAMVAWFLLSHTVKGVGAAILLTAIILTAAYTLVFRLLGKVRRGAKALTTAVMAAVCLFVFLSVTIYAVAPTQLFYPHFDKESYTKLKTDPKAEELTVQTAGGVLSGWLYHSAADGAPLVLYFPGNGENAATRVLKLAESSGLSIFKGCSFAVFDYPGYGKSSGSPSEKTLKAAGLATYDALAKRADVDKSRIIVFGYSIGTGVANYVASERPAAGLMLMAPYADGYDLYNNFADVFHGPLRLLVAFKMDSVEFARNVKVKPLILASKSDKMVSYASSVRLSGAYPSGCMFKAIPGIGHNDFWGSDAALQAVTDYLKGVCAK